MSVPEPTGFCHACGRGCFLHLSFCNPKCRRAWERDQRMEERRVVKRGKRDNYGPTGV